MALPLIVSVGGVLIRTTAKQLPKLLRRFKNSKEVFDPTPSQVDAASRLTKNYTNFSKKSQKILKKADTANPSLLQRVTGRGRTPTQKDMKPNPSLTTGEAKRQKTINRIVGGGVTGLTVAGIMGIRSKKKLEELKEQNLNSELSAAVNKALRIVAEKDAAKAKLGKVKPKPRPEERSGNSKGGMTDYRKTGLFR